MKHFEKKCKERIKSLERFAHLNDNVSDKDKRQAMKKSNSLKGARVCTHAYVTERHPAVDQSC